MERSYFSGDGDGLAIGYIVYWPFGRGRYRPLAAKIV
jgi:hypothetical protein